MTSACWVTRITHIDSQSHSGLHNYHITIHFYQSEWLDTGVSLVETKELNSALENNRSSVSCKNILDLDFIYPPTPVHLRVASASHARNADVWDWKLSHGRYIIHFLLELSGPVRHLQQTFGRLRGKPVLLSLYRRFILYPYTFPLIFITKKCLQGKQRNEPLARSRRSAGRALEAEGAAVSSISARHTHCVLRVLAGLYGGAHGTSGSLLLTPLTQEPLRYGRYLSRRSSALSSKRM